MKLVFGHKKPRQPILGTELAGTIEEVGPSVTKFRTGDQVFAYADAGMGAHAEFKCMPERGLVALKPDSLTFEEAAALSFGGMTALHFLKKADLRRGESVLVNGASGGVGTAALQLAKYFGTEVTAVCSSANTDLVRSLGADHVIDHAKEDFTRNGRRYDVIMDAVGTAPYRRSKASLSRNGRLLLVVAGLPQMLPIPWVSLTGTKKIFAGPAASRIDDLKFLADLAEKRIFRPFIDRRFPFEQMIEAHRYVDSGRKRGNVVITLP